MDSNLMEDDKSTQPGAFVGATLQLNSADKRAGSDVEFKGTGLDDSAAGGGGLDRGGRPGSTMSRKSTGSTGSHTTASKKIVTTDYIKALYFSQKNGAFENAVEWCQREVVKNDLDGEVRGAWLLSEIDHWDHQREKMVLLTDHSLLIIRYDFITTKMLEMKRVALHLINTIQMGDFQYPAKSLMTKLSPRDHGGIRVYWGDPVSLTAGQKWNPFCSDVPYTSFAHHPLLYNPKETETITYNIDDFSESLIQAVNNAIKGKTPGKNLVVREEPILIESYASLSSIIFNQSHIGFNRDRGGVSF